MHLLSLNEQFSRIVTLHGWVGLSNIFFNETRAVFI